jgi:hypothetical protein
MFSSESLLRRLFLSGLESLFGRPLTLLVRDSFTCLSKVPSSLGSVPLIGDILVPLLAFIFDAGIN